jgi:hypothetical protein
VQIKLSIHLEEHMIRVSTLDKCTHMLSMCMHICVIIDIYPFLLDSKAKNVVLHIFFIFMAALKHFFT